MSMSLPLERSSAEAELETVISSRRQTGVSGLKSLWRHRELLLTLTWRDVKVRYKQTVLGAVWVVLQPLSTMLVFSFFFGRLAKLDSDGIPYPIFCFTALLPWMYFSSSLSLTSNSLLGNANLITKVFFPRAVIPVSSVLSGLVDLLISFVVLMAMMAWYGMRPSPAILLLPIPIAMTVMTALGAGFWLSALNVQFRDVRFTIPFLTQIWMYLSPIAYSSSLIDSPNLRIAYALNPLVGIIEFFRWAICGTATGESPLIVLVSASVSAIMVVTGAMYFRRMESGFADLV